MWHRPAIESHFLPLLVGGIRPSVVDTVVNADGVEEETGSLLPGPCISPPKANVALEIITMDPRNKHRMVFIGFGPFGDYQTTKSLSTKIITPLVADATK